MLTEVHPNLYVAGIEHCPLTYRRNEDWAGVIHACKDPCHARVVGHRVAKDDPQYLWAERPVDLWLNMIDPPVPLFKAELFNKALDFISERIQKGRVLVHCNEGLSRAPTIALVWLAKRARMLPVENYQDARVAFESKMPDYAPGLGIQIFLRGHWEEVG